MAEDQDRGGNCGRASQLIMTPFGYEPKFRGPPG
jgi:hypothetical protein